MNLLHIFFKTIDRISNFKEAHAHCDVPCGIYDTHRAQMAAHTVLRMVQLIHELPKHNENTTPHEMEEYSHKMARYTHTKEEHAEVVKHEVRILWGDYFKPEHLKDHPELHDLVWKAMKLGGKVKQEINLEASDELLKVVQKIAEIFRKTKGVETHRVKAPYPTGAEMVVPKN